MKICNLTAKELFFQILLTVRASFCAELEVVQTSHMLLVTTQIILQCTSISKKLKFHFSFTVSEKFLMPTRPKLRILRECPQIKEPLIPARHLAPSAQQHIDRPSHGPVIASQVHKAVMCHQKFQQYIFKIEIQLEVVFQGSYSVKSIYCAQNAVSEQSDQKFLSAQITPEVMMLISLLHIKDFRARRKMLTKAEPSTWRFLCLLD